MSDTVIRVENLGKKYIIGHQANAHRTLRDVLADSLSAPFRRLRRTTDDGRRATDDDPQSSVSGLPLGRRSPVAGRRSFRRVLGIKGHQFRSGFLNGAILGMSRGQIKRKFDEIVAFAKVEKFLDNPVKYYSSGIC
jgi:lipopolysaccharide transport system ATP-binding protein